MVNTIFEGVVCSTTKGKPCWGSVLSLPIVHSYFVELGRFYFLQRGTCFVSKIYFWGCSSLLVVRPGAPSRVPTPSSGRGTSNKQQDTLVVRTKLKSQLSSATKRKTASTMYFCQGGMQGQRKGKLAKTIFSQRSLPSYNLIKPQQSTFKAARPQILVRRTRPKNDFAKGKTTKPSLFQVQGSFSSTNSG